MLVPTVALRDREDNSVEDKLLEIIFHQLSPLLRLTQAAREGTNFSSSPLFSRWLKSTESCQLSRTRAAD